MHLQAVMEVMETLYSLVDWSPSEFTAQYAVRRGSLGV